MKLLPFTVMLNAAPPAIAEFGMIVLSAGIGVVTLNCNGFDVPPPGAGLVTLTLKKFAVETSAARIAAVSWVALTNVVVRV